MLPLAAVSGCDGPDVLAAPPSPAPDVTVLRGAITAEQLMITRYTTVLHQAGAAGGSAGSWQARSSRCWRSTARTSPSSGPG